MEEGSIYGVIFIVAIAFINGLRGVFMYFIYNYQIYATVEEIRKIVSQSKNGRSVRYMGRCSYVYNGIEVVSRRMNFGKMYSVGEQVDVYINPRRPSNAIKSRTTMLFGGLIFILMSILIASFYILPNMDMLYQFSNDNKNPESQIVSSQGTANRSEHVTTNNSQKKQSEQTSMEILMEGKDRVYEANGEYYVQNLFRSFSMYTPGWISKAVNYYGVKNGNKTVLYDKRTGDVYMKISYLINSNNYDQQKSYAVLRNWVKKNGTGIKAVKSMESSGEKIEVYSQAKKNKNGQITYQYYAIAADHKGMYMFICYGDLQEFIKILSTTSY